MKYMYYCPDCDAVFRLNSNSSKDCIICNKPTKELGYSEEQ